MTRQLLSSAAVLALVASGANAITVTANSDAQDLAEALFLNVPGLSITSSNLSIEFSGQAGTYTNDVGTYGLPDGIIFSTGFAEGYGTGGGFGGGGEFDEGIGGEFGDGVFDEDNPPPTVATFVEVADVPTPVDQTAVGVQSATFSTTNSVDTSTCATFSNIGEATLEQCALLNPITGQQEHNDVVQLTIEFDAAEDIDSVTFFGAFGSNEFDTYVGTEFVDGFGLYVNGTNVAGVIPAGADENDDPLAVNINHPDFDFNNATGLNGMLQPNGQQLLRFDVPIKAGEANMFDIILADASDNSFDTTVYLSSFIPTDVVGGGNGGGVVGGGGQVEGAGSNEFNPILPVNPPDPETGEFIIVLPEVVVDQIFWIDPPVAVGYEYTTDIGLISAIKLPSLAAVMDIDGLYTVEVGGVEKTFGAFEDVDLLAEFGLTEGVSVFTVSGILTDDPINDQDPSDPLAFPIGVSFSSITDPNGTIGITPLTIDVPDVAPIPLPASGVLLGAGLFGMVALRRRKAQSA